MDDNRRGLKTDRNRFVALAFCWADLLFELGPRGTIQFVAGATEQFFGRSESQLIGTAFDDLVVPSDVPLLHQFQTTQYGRVHEETIRLRGVTGQVVWVTLSGYRLEASEGPFYVGARRVQSTARAAALAARPASQGGLFDATAFSHVAADRIKRLQAAGTGADVTLVALPGLADIGAQGDPRTCVELMNAVSNVLKAHSIGGDSAAQVTPERFSLMQAEGSDTTALTTQLSEIVRRIDPTGRGVTPEAASLSMGAIGNVSETDLANGLLYALNRFKTEEGAGVSLQRLATSMPDLLDEAMNEVSSFKSVIANNEFNVVLQPIVHAQHGEIHHFEALCRFEGDKSPFRTITFAEETGLIPDFDLAMLRKVLELLHSLPRNRAKYRAAVNVSGFSMGTPAYIDTVMGLLAANPWAKGRLLFEITESSRMTDLDIANAIIQRFRTAGYPVCLDDFGAGAASFQYLSLLDVDMVKIDGSAVRNAQRAPKGRAFLSALTELCNRMGVETIAEMVDSRDSLQFCRDCGCDYVQGFLFGRPSANPADFSPLPHGGMFKRPSQRTYRRV